MDPILTLGYTPQKNDYAQVLRIYFLQQTGSRIALAFLVIAFGVVVYTVATSGRPLTIFDLVWLLLPPVFVGYILYVQPRNMANQAMVNEQLAAETTWEMGDEGINISTSFGSAHTAWDDFSRMYEHKEYILLVLKGKKRAFRFIPRRAFVAPQDQDRFFELVQAHLTK